MEGRTVVPDGVYCGIAGGRIRYRRRRRCLLWLEGAQDGHICFPCHQRRRFLPMDTSSFHLLCTSSWRSIHYRDAEVLAAGYP